MSRAAPRRPPGRLHRPRTLRAQLVASVLALFVVVMLATGIGTVLLTRHYLEGQLRASLQESAVRIPAYGQREHPADDHDDDPRPPLPGAGADLRLELVGGAVVVRGGYPMNRVGYGESLTAEQVRAIETAGLGSEPRRVDLGGNEGTYLLVARADGGHVVVTGVATRGVEDTLGRLTLLISGGTLAGIVLVALGGTYLVRRSLEPLDRVAATARSVSQLKLDSGDVALAERVPAPDTDPRTEVGQVGLAINTMLDNVESALQARQLSESQVRQFVADASHELRTPLASIRGYAELSRRERDPVPPTVTHAMGRVESEALRMQGLVEDLLLLARLDAGRPLEREPVDLTLLAMDAVSDAHAAAPDHVWELDLPDEPVEVPGDRGRLHQILANLLANARTHTPEGTRVVTRIRPEGHDVVRLSVSDDGPGIPEALRPNVFERFTRGDDSRSRAAGSTGLGLSIVAAVSQAHGGRVELTSSTGGSTFSVLLPAR